MLQTGLAEDEERYRNQKKITKNTYRRNKRIFLARKVEYIETTYKKKEIRNFYQGMKKTGRKTQQKMLFCKDKDGKLIGE